MRFRSTRSQWLNRLKGKHRKHRTEGTEGINFCCNLYLRQQNVQVRILIMYISVNTHTRTLHSSIINLLYTHSLTHSHSFVCSALGFDARQRAVAPPARPSPAAQPAHGLSHPAVMASLAVRFPTARIKRLVSFRGDAICT